MNEMTTYRWSFVEDVTEYTEAGISGIGVWRPKLVEFGEERGIDLIHDSRLRVSSLSWAGGFTGSNGHGFAEAIDDARDSIEVAERLGAGCLVVISGSRGGHTLNHARRLLIDALTSLADDAGERDVTLAVEPMHHMFAPEWSFLTSLDETLGVLDLCDHPYVKLAFDVYHLWQEPGLLARIPEIVEQVGIVQLNDWRNPPRSDTDRLLPGEGEIPLAEMTHAFEDAGYQGFYEIEVWSEQVWRSDYAALLRNCRDRFGSFGCR